MEYSNKLFFISDDSQQDDEPGSPSCSSDKYRKTLRLTSKQIVSLE